MRDDRALVIEVPKDWHGNEISYGKVNVYIGLEKREERDLGGRLTEIRWTKVKPLHCYNRFGTGGFNLGFKDDGHSELAYSIAMLFKAEDLYLPIKWEIIARLNRTDQTIPLSHLKMLIAVQRSKYPKDRYRL